MSEPLKPCPFCGGGASHAEDPRHNYAEVDHCVVCDKCGASTAWHYTADGAAESWNTRQ